MLMLLLSKGIIELLGGLYAIQNTSYIRQNRLYYLLGGLYAIQNTSYIRQNRLYYLFIYFSYFSTLFCSSDYMTIP